MMLAAPPPDTKLVVSLVTRVSEKLPVNSGLPLSYLENDPLFTQNVVAIIELSQWRLREIASTLSTLLDTVSKAHTLTADDYLMSMDVLQSQLFVLRLLGNCMAHYWKCYRESVANNVPRRNSAPNLRKDSS
ncbi:Ras GTPase activating protein ira2, partial [Quaeritorhiza haematococci]